MLHMYAGARIDLAVAVLLSWNMVTKNFLLVLLPYYITYHYSVLTWYRPQVQHTVYSMYRIGYNMIMATDCTP